MAVPVIAAPSVNECQGVLDASFTRGTDASIQMSDGALFPNPTPLGHVVRIANTANTKWCLVVYDDKSDADTLTMDAAADYADAKNVTTGDEAYEWPIGSTVELICAADEIALLFARNLSNDATWAAAGDLVQGTGNDAAAVLTKGTALALLKMNAGGTAVEWGTAGQIAFPATAVPSGDANTMDDYEEGTWTPTYVPHTNAFGSVTYRFQNGKYTKLGNVVVIACQIGTDDIPVGTTDGTERVLINGLPFSSVSVYNNGMAFGGATVFTGQVPFEANCEPGSIRLRLFYRDAIAGESEPTLVSDLDKTTNYGNVIDVGGNYFT